MSVMVEKLLKLYKEQKLPKETVVDLIETLKQQGETQSRAVRHQKIAVIGASCRMPEANNPRQFWHNLLHKKNSVRDFPERRAQDIRPLRKGLDESRFVPGKEFWRAGYLDQIDGFDAEFFSIFPADAQVMDPQQRLFLEVAHEAFEDAGYTRGQLRGSKTGIYLGDVNFEYKDLIQDTTAAAVVGNISPFICGRVARFYHLNGPTVNISTTCSSSLVAAHMAVQGLMQGDCDLALTGAINLRLFPFFLKNDPVDALNITSPEECCRPFDHRANGVARGEGGGALLLKRYDDAVADGDPIYATIIASEVNNDGHSSSVGAPSPAGQVKLIKAALAKAKVDPETIAYIEAHGTGTKIGDPIEIQALTKAFAELTEAKQFCGIGSIKTNIGHLTGGAAGFAGLLKVVLSLKHGAVPASLHFEQPNELIDFSESPLFFVADTLDLKASTPEPHRAGVSSFGFNGSNCHMILEEHRSKNTVTNNTDRAYPIVLSAHSEAALKQLIQRHLDALNAGHYEQYNLQDIAYTLAYGRDAHSYRIAGFANDHNSLAQLLLTWLKDDAKTPTLPLLQGFLDGDSFDFTRFFTNEQGQSVGRRVSLITYPFQRQRFWIENARLKWADVQTSSEVEPVWPLDSESVKKCWVKVLGINQLADDSDFFALGGDSLLASQLLATVKKHMRLDVPYKVLAEHSSLHGFSQEILLHSPELMSEPEPITTTKAQQANNSGVDQSLPLSHSQKRMWAQHYLVGDTNVYNMPQVLKFTGAYDHQRLVRAIEQLVAAHPPLRTIFLKEGKEVRQHIIEPALNIDIPYLDFTEKHDQEVLDYINERVYQAFDLSVFPLFQCFVCRRSEQEHLLVFSIDHIISDGWSLHLMFGDILQAYLGSSLEDQRNRDYAVYVHDEQEWLASTAAQRARNFWVDQLSGTLPYTEIVGDQPRPELRSYTGSDQHYRIDANTTARADAITRNTGLTLYTLFLASVYLLTYQRSQQRDMIIGAPIAGRLSSDYDALLGCLINVLPVRFELNLEHDFITLCQALHERLLDCFEHQRYPYDELVAELDVEADLTRNTMFGINVAQQNFNALARDLPDIEGTQIEHFPLPSITCKWDLHFEFIKDADGIDARLEYASDIYSAEFASKLIKSQQALFSDLLENPDTPLKLLLKEDEEFSLEW